MLESMLESEFQLCCYEAKYESTRLTAIGLVKGGDDRQNRKWFYAIIFIAFFFYKRVHVVEEEKPRGFDLLTFELLIE